MQDWQVEKFEDEEHNRKISFAYFKVVGPSGGINNTGIKLLIRLTAPALLGVRVCGYI